MALKSDKGLALNEVVTYDRLHMIKMEIAGKPANTAPFSISCENKWYISDSNNNKAFSPDEKIEDRSVVRFKVEDVETLAAQMASEGDLEFAQLTQQTMGYVQMWIAAYLTRFRSDECGNVSVV